MAASKKQSETASTETLVRLIAMQLGISDQNGLLMPVWERRLRPVEGVAYTASSVLQKTEDTLAEDPSADAAVRELEAELALQQAQGQEVEQP